jgi:type I restriction enzyme S subunit
MVMPLPPLPTQQSIAGILSAYDELIENSQRRIKILETMVCALYREWFVHFRFPGSENHPRVASALGEIPQGWEVKPIKHFGAVVTGKTPSKANADFYGDDVPFVKTPDMHGSMFLLDVNERLSIAGAKSQANKTLPIGSICVSCIGTIGVVSMTTEECQTNQQINSVILKSSASREFLFLRLQDAKQALENLGSNGATMGNVNKGKFESMEIVSPAPELLAKFHYVVKPMFSEILALSRQIQNLRRTRDLILPRLLSGQINVESTLP